MRGCAVCSHPFIADVRFGGPGSAKMSQVKSFLRDLDEAILRGSPESRMRALWHTTDLLIAGRYSDDEIRTFGEVIGRLADQIEVAARPQLARRLGRVGPAPPHTNQRPALYARD